MCFNSYITFREAYTLSLFCSVQGNGDSFLEHSGIVGSIASHNMQWNYRFSYSCDLKIPQFKKHSHEHLVRTPVKFLVCYCLNSAYPGDSTQIWVDESMELQSNSGDPCAPSICVEHSWKSSRNRWKANGARILSQWTVRCDYLASNRNRLVLIYRPFSLLVISADCLLCHIKNPPQSFNLNLVAFARTLGS